MDREPIIRNIRRGGPASTAFLESPPPGGMRARVDGFDWGKTPLGPRANWPSELEIGVQQILDSSFPKAIAWGPELTTIYNDAFVPILGSKPDALGRSFSDSWAEVWDTVGPFAERAFAGIPTYIEDLPLVINRTGENERAWFTFCYSPLRMADGRIGGMLDTVIETTGNVRAQADLALMNQELGHRLKNTLALVQAIAVQTLQGAAPPDAMESFISRLSALGHAHDILLQQEWSAASFLQVVTASIKPHDALNQVVLDGPDMQIGSRAAVALSLMLNELGTNAVKYGALSTPPDGCGCHGISQRAIFAFIGTSPADRLRPNPVISASDRALSTKGWGVEVR